MKKTEFVYIGERTDYRERCESICKEMDYVFDHCANVEELFEREAAFSKASFVFLSANGLTNKEDIAGMLQVVKQVANASYCAVCVDSKLEPESLSFVKKSGANLVLLESEMASSCKMEFAASQVIKEKFFPIKISELVMEAPINIEFYYLLPMNRKFALFLRKGDFVKTERLERLRDINELYIKREDIDEWANYTKQHAGESLMTRQRQCRAQFVQMSLSFFDMALMLSDRSEYTSFESGRALYKKCEDFARGLLDSLSSLEKPWEVIDECALFSYGPIERSPAVACYAGLLAAKSGAKNPSEVMVAALMSDLGLLNVSPRIITALRSSAVEGLHEEDLKVYQNHPVESLNQLLSRKMPVPESVKNMILCSHERFDQKGFPYQPVIEKIPNESYLIQICQLLDQQSLVKMGEKRLGFAAVKDKFFEVESVSESRFPLTLLLQVQRML